MNEERIQKGVQILADAAIYALKKLSASEQGLSSASLAEVLRERDDIKEILVYNPSVDLMNETNELKRDNAELKNQINSFKSQMETFQRQKERKERQGLDVNDTEEREFMKRALIMFISMLRTRDNEAYFETFDQLKKLLLSNADIKQMEKFLSKIQKIALWEEETFVQEGKISRRDDYHRMEETNERLEKQIEMAVAQRDRLEKSIVEIEDGFKKQESFYKRTMLLLLTLSRTSENKSYFTVIDRFKKLIQENADLERMERVVESLQNLSLQEDAPSESLNPPELAKTEIVHSENALENIKDCFFDLILEFQVNISEQYLKQASDVLQKLRESKSFEDIVALKKDIIALLQVFTQSFHDEREHVANFMSEIKGRLGDIEGQVASSFDDARKAHQSNIKYDEKLEKQMEDIKGSMTFSKTLLEIKKVIMSAVARVKGALEKKKQDSQSLMENADEKMSTIHAKLADMKKEIAQVQNRTIFLEHELLIDPITGIFNRRAYEKRLIEEFQKYMTNRNAFSILIFDVDNFRTISHTYGHSAGDQCLKYVALKVKGFLRTKDYFARYSGDEFMILLTETEDKEACEAGEYLIELVQRMRFTFKGEVIPLTISVGVTQIYASDKDTDVLFDRVHKAMYAAKKSGRKKVVCCRRAGLAGTPGVADHFESFPVVVQ